jgi:hypothetical protein
MEPKKAIFIHLIHVDIISPQFKKKTEFDKDKF